MTTQEKKEKIKSLIVDSLNESHQIMINNIDKVFNSGAVDIDAWDENISPMILPKTIITAILKNESTQYDGKGTSFYKKIKKDSENILLFI
jgi:hypothetical protein